MGSIRRIPSAVPSARSGLPRAQEIKRIQLRSRRMVSGDLLGQYRSAFRGTGLIYTDIREYQPGDDVKHIHWRATARTGTVYVKSYQEDRQLRVMLAVDSSASLRAPWSAQTQTKALEFASLVSSLAQRGNDPVGLCLFGKKTEQFLSPKSGAGRHHRILATLSTNRPAHKKTDLAEALSYLSSHLRKPSIVFVVSDFYCPPFREELERLSVRHDVVLVQLEHPPEALPRTGLVSLCDAETGDEVLVDSSSRSVREAWDEVMAQRRAALASLAKSCRASHIIIRDNALKPLALLMKERAKRIR